MNSQFDMHELKVLECIFVNRENREKPLEEKHITHYLEKHGFKNSELVARLAFTKLMEKGHITESYGFQGIPSYLLTDSGEKLFLGHSIPLSEMLQLENSDEV